MSEWSIVRHSKCRARKGRGFESPSLRQKQKALFRGLFCFFCVVQEEWDSNPKGHFILYAIYDFPRIIPNKSLLNLGKILKIMLYYVL